MLCYLFQPIFVLHFSSSCLQCSHGGTDNYHWTTLTWKKIETRDDSLASSSLIKGASFFLWYLSGFMDVYPWDMKHNILRKCKSHWVDPQTSLRNSQNVHVAPLSVIAIQHNPANMSHHTQLRITYENSHIHTDFNNRLASSSILEICKDQASHVGDMF